MTELEALRRRMLALEAENRDLRRRLAFHETGERYASGVEKEADIANLIRGFRARRNAGHDLRTRSGKLVEVKFSELNHPARGKAATRRWTWSNLLGQGGNKRYDYLVLLGAKDPRYERAYRAEPDWPYVTFLLEYRQVVDFPDLAGRGGAQLQISSRPLRGASFAALGLGDGPGDREYLFTVYETNRAGLVSRLG